MDCQHLRHATSRRSQGGDHATRNARDAHMPRLKQKAISNEATHMEKTKQTTQVNQASKINLPEIKFRAGAICATVWKNDGVSKDGEATEYRTVSFERGYKDKNGEWKSTSSLRVNDLPRAALVLQKAYEYIALNGNAEVAA